MRVALMLACLLTAPAAFGQDDTRLQYRLTDVVIAGSPAKMTLFANDDVNHVAITLTPSKGKVVKFALAHMGGGEQKELTFPVPKGESQWKASLAWDEGTSHRTANVDLVVQSLLPLDVRVDKKDVYLDEGRIVATPTRSLASAEVVIRDQSGNIVVERQVDVAGSEPGKPVDVRWDMPEGSEARVADLKFFDQHGFWAAVRVVALSVNIPHEEVVFETAKWDIRPEEAPKLDSAIEKVRGELARFQRDLGKVGIEVEGALYVAGYTDTVGGPGDNQALSDKRARAIAEYFAAHGLALPVYYQGFGEGALAVPTPDDTDEQKNRRAAYVLGSAAPGGKDFPGAAWKRLK